MEEKDVLKGSYFWDSDNGWLFKAGEYIYPTDYRWEYNKLYVATAIPLTNELLLAIGFALETNGVYSKDELVVEIDGTKNMYKTNDGIGFDYLHELQKVYFDKHNKKMSILDDDVYSYLKNLTILLQAKMPQIKYNPK